MKGIDKIATQKVWLRPSLFLFSMTMTDLSHIQVFEIKNLHLLAREVVEGFITGMHKSPFPGFSVEFSDSNSSILSDAFSNSKTPPNFIQHIIYIICCFF